jgi:hypothetical protein
MSNNQKVIAVSAGLIILGLYYFYKQSKQDSVTAEEEKQQIGESQTTKQDWDKILKKGSMGVEVAVLQRALKQLKDDGDFGALTEARLKNVTGLTQITLNQYNTIIKNKAKTTASTNKSVFSV